MIIKKIIVVIFLFGLLNSCAQNTILLGPAYTLGTTGSIYQAGFAFGSNEAITSLTGKSAAANIQVILKPEDKNAEFKRLVKKRVKETRKKLNFTNQ